MPLNIKNVNISARLGDRGHLRRFEGDTSTVAPKRRKKIGNDDLLGVVPRYAGASTDARNQNARVSHNRVADAGRPPSISFRSQRAN